MDKFSNEVLFYGGLIAAGISAVVLLVFFVVFIINKVKLNARFDVEYGESTRKDKRK